MGTPSLMEEDEIATEDAATVLTALSLQDDALKSGEAESEAVERLGERSASDEDAFAAAREAASELPYEWPEASTAQRAALMAAWEADAAQMPEHMRQLWAMAPEELRPAVRVPPWVQQSGTGVPRPRRTPGTGPRLRHTFGIG